MTFPLICYTMTQENKKTPLCFCVVPCELHALQSPGPPREPLFSESWFSPPKVRLTAISWWLQDTRHNRCSGKALQPGLQGAPSSLASWPSAHTTASFRVRCS